MTRFRQGGHGTGHVHQKFFHALAWDNVPWPNQWAVAKKQTLLRPRGLWMGY
jgi:hypothetical protein